mmetsp:Transcript_21321/g.52186  ORF Transcript_21321/g.52186 Transcript_21321/m.52186 type:complete len:336 (-) Transcript_21321:283-1290(-)|eukprot:CAMPEP_0114518158 /NCGR_PEP_ID=MMETSP0109-20121206/18289_1 /TAXON_ID=29199 /ORGANISM="Chlorarachnion reptans, Strain CCCM449" /LENGTH=335 /DNA_ID=CAMNT_0001698749 /DNA_START=386 /DNA_END=1393 /DNA_ORIENTATION=+
MPGPSSNQFVGRTNGTLQDAIHEWDENTKGLRAEIKKLKEERLSHREPKLDRNHVLAGGLSGLCADAILHPIDMIRTRHQINQSHNSGVLYTLFDLSRTNGLRYLFKGFGSNALSAPLSNALFYAGYDYTKAWVHYNVISERQQPLLVHSVAGFWATLLGGLVWVPSENVMRRAQATEDPRNGTVRVARAIMRDQGIMGFYRNYWMSIGVWGPYCSIYFVTYEWMKRKLAISKVEEDMSIKYLACSAVAATVGVAVTNPLDMIRVRYMVEGDGGLKGRFQYKSIEHAFLNIVRREGVLALGKGLSARIIWHVANDSLGITLYEKLKHWLRARDRS